ncbi:helix-turn-helix domain-containing protein [Streptomyces sp. NPDC005438]|uniref:TetR/AcrR family transcriptional regulator n=1 Tax=Streptomyces sp. NPDC005438 TaxID=3156880 RepID=UPI0033B8687D
MSDDLTPGARRILDVASRLFYERGIHAVGVDLIATESGVTKRTLYDRFRSKDALVAAYLRERDERWRHTVTERLAALEDPAARVLAPFDVLTTWLPVDSRGCAFVNAYAELPDRAHPARAVIAGGKAWLRELFRAELAAGGAADPDAAAAQLLVVHEGAMVAGTSGGMPDALGAARALAARIRDGALGRG